MSFTLTEEAKIIAKMGENNNVETNTLSGTLIQDWYDDAVGVFNVATRNDWVSGTHIAAYNYKGAISEAVSSWAAMNGISYDMTGYQAGEAETMLDFYSTQFNKVVELLNKIENKDLVD